MQLDFWRIFARPEPKPQTLHVLLPDGRTVPYRIQPSARARRLRLKVAPGQGLVVVTPRGFGKRRIEEIVLRERDWIAKHISRGHPVAEPERPESLDLRAVGEIWNLSYVENRSGSVRIGIPGPGRMTLTGAVHRKEALRRAFKRFLKSRAETDFVPRLREIARQLGVRYSAVRIKGQRSRWGSCSSKGTISLNHHLLFLPPETVRYVLVHELCHTIEMNHSRAFWNLVESHVPDARAHRKLLRTAHERVPAWFREG